MCVASLIIGLMYGLIDTLLPIFTIQELGWTNTSYSQVYSITTVVGGFFGMFVGGALVDFFVAVVAILGLTNKLMCFDAQIVRFDFRIRALIRIVFLTHKHLLGLIDLCRSIGKK